MVKNTAWLVSKNVDFLPSKLWANIWGTCIEGGVCVPQGDSTLLLIGGGFWRPNEVRDVMYGLIISGFTMTCIFCISNAFCLYQKMSPLYVAVDASVGVCALALVVASWGFYLDQVYYSNKGVDYDAGAVLGPGYGSTVASSFFLLLALVFGGCRVCCVRGGDEDSSALPAAGKSGGGPAVEGGEATAGEARAPTVGVVRA